MCRLLVARELLKAIDGARAQARAAVWSAAGEHTPDHAVSAGAPVVIDVDATLVTAHSEKENAAPTDKRGFGFQPLWTFADHGADGTGGPLACLLLKGQRRRKHRRRSHHRRPRGIDATTRAPTGTSAGRKVLIRTDSAGSPTVPELAHQPAAVLLGRVRAAYQLRRHRERYARRGSDPRVRRRRPATRERLGSWAAGMRVLIRKERPTPARSYASLMLTGTGSPRSRQTHPAGCWPIWSYGTADGLAARTGSVTRKTQV